MAKRKPVKRIIKRRNYSKRKKKIFFRRKILLVILALALIGTGFFLKEKIAFYYAIYFQKFTHRKLSNTEEETKRINRIIGENANKTFGIDLSHYQKKEDIKWDSLSIGNKSIPIKFVILRVTMGNKNADKHFSTFWKLAKKNNLIRGAYHYYRSDEDPVFQANNFMANVKLETGDLPPILDIEKIPQKKTKENLIKDLKVWCKIVEQAYGEKPIIYTYAHYYRDYLREDFKDFPLWLANYNDVSTPSSEDDWDIWQFSENGIVYGINSKVDLDFYNGSLWSLKRMTLDLE